MAVAEVKGEANNSQLKKTLNLKNIHQEVVESKNEIQTSENQIDNTKPKTTFGLAELETTWKLFAIEAKEENAHKAMLMVNTSTISFEKQLVTIHLENSVQQDQLISLKEEITLFLREKLNNYSITITSEIKETIESNQKAYTSQEKFDLMAEINPSLLLFKDLFQLEAGH